MQLNDVTDAVVERLAQLGVNGAPVLSLYVDLDPSRAPTPRERSGELSALLDRAEQEELRGAPLTREQRMNLEGDIQRLRRLFDGDSGAATGAHGLAAFCGGAKHTFEVLKLPHSVQPSATLDRFPRLLPLLAQRAHDRWAVLLITRATARILRGERDRLSEVARFRDDVHRRHEQGGWSQARYQRGIEKEVHDHAKRAAAALFEESEQRPFDHLIVGCSNDLWPEISSTLHPYLAARMRAQIELDIERSTPDEVFRRVAPLMTATEQAHEREAIEQLGTGLGQSGTSAVGLDEVVTALNEHRVGVLLLLEGARLSGFSCPNCGWLAATGGSCPVDGAVLEPTDDLAELGAQAALRDGAEMLLVHHAIAELSERGSIAGLLRY